MAYPYGIGDKIFGIGVLSYPVTPENDFKYAVTNQYIIKDNYFFVKPNNLQAAATQVIKMCFYVGNYQVMKYERNSAGYKLIIKSLDPISREKDLKHNVKTRAIEDKDIGNCTFSNEESAIIVLPSYVNILKEYINYQGKKKLELRYTI